MSPAGYSGTPLARKLGIKPGHRVAVLNEPDEFRDLLVGLPDDVAFTHDLGEAPDILLAFFTALDDLDSTLPSITGEIHPDRVAWIAWPKKASGVETDLTGDVVRARVLATTLVDVKVCAISEVWSGLKVVWRREHR